MNLLTIPAFSRHRLIMKRLRTAPLAAALALGLIVPSLPAPPSALAAPETFVVNTTADSNNGCDPAPGDCSLREAISAANANGNAGEFDRIEFNIPGQGVQTIRPTSPLPFNLQRLIVDGYTQPGAQENTAAEGTNAVLLIELDGSQAGAAAGLVNSGGAAMVVRGLAINSFAQQGIRSEGLNLDVEGSFIGTNAAGAAAKPNGGVGVLAEAGAGGSTVSIGGQPGQVAKRNLISGNAGGGISTGSLNPKIGNNLIGTDRSGNRPLPNERFGVQLRAAGEVTNNAISFNGGNGVNVTGNNSLLSQNAMRGNQGLGIDLNADGRTANDPGDADAGPNNRQNFPDITSATTPKAKKKKGKKGKKGNKATTTTIVGTLNSLPNQTYMVELFGNSGNANGEGAEFLVEQPVVTDAAGNADFTVTLNRSLKGQSITATATSVEINETSEYSDAEQVKQVKKGKKGKKGKKSSLAAVESEASGSAAELDPGLDGDDSASVHNAHSSGSDDDAKASAKARDGGKHDGKAKGGKHHKHDKQGRHGKRR
jgi:CSLREA domain-containing protein